MKNQLGFYRPVGALALAISLGWFGSACATKGYVRQEVQASATTLSARMDTTDRNVQDNSAQIKNNSGQIQELSSLNKENAQRVSAMSTELKQVGDTAGTARSTADQALKNANQASTQVTTLNGKFTNRNQYETSTEKFVYFRFNSWQLDSSYNQDLDQVAEMVKQSPDAIVTLTGHTDTSGEASYNLQLGERRMEVVYNYLAVEKAVPVYKIYKLSVGEAQPIDSNNTSEGRAKNRCTAIQVLVPKG